MNCKSEDAIAPLIRCFARKLQKVSQQNSSILDTKFKLSKPQIQSIKASMNLMFQLCSFEAFVNTYQDALYDAELAPYIKIANDFLTIHIYASGKMNILGAKSVAHIIDFIQIWYPRLLEFKKVPCKKELNSKREFIKPMDQNEFTTKIAEKKMKFQTLTHYLPLELAQMLCS